jgi:hypothetical protein
MLLCWIKVLLLLITFLINTNNHFANATKPQIPQERGLYWKFEPFDNKINTTDVKEIHVVFSNHLDVGFNSRAWCDGGSLQGCIGPEKFIDGQQCRPWSYAVVNGNMNIFLPRAANLANELRFTKYEFTYMTQPYIVAFLLDCEESGLTDWREGPTHGANLLECPNATVIQQFKNAVKRGDIWWHAFPHNPMPGLYDSSLFNASLAIGRDLAKRLGVRPPTTYSQRDETGMTRSIIPLLQANNINMISLGAGGGSGGHPVIPDLFVWKDNATNTSVIFVFDHGYGGGLHVLPSNGVGIYCAWNTDNGGPLPQENIEGIYKGLRQKYPNANVHQSSFDKFYDVAIKNTQGLPVVTKEIGDTWLYGVPADPFKNVMFRELSRHRRNCIESNLCNVSDITMQRFDRLLTKIPEHTWGEDTTWYLSRYLGYRSYPLGDYMNWTNVQFETALKTSPEYHMTIESWLDQRNYLNSAIEILEKDKAYVSLAEQMKNAMLAILPSVPDINMTEYEKVQGTPIEQSANAYTCNGYTYRINMDMGMILDAETTSTSAAAAETSEHVLGLYTYQTLDASDYTKFDQDYGMAYCTPTTEDAGCHNFNKPNMTSANPIHSETNPTLVQIYIKKSNSGSSRNNNDNNNHGDNSDDVCAFHVTGSLPEKIHEYYGAPSTIWTSVEFVNSTISFNIQWFNKTRTRLAESQWVTFDPFVTDPNNGGWRMRGFRKTGLNNDAANNGIDPMKVVTHGAVHLHSMGPLSTIEYHDNNENIILTSLDVPIVSAGLLSPFPTPGNWTIDLSNGMHYNLQNNIWNVNFPQWYPFVDEDRNARFRFQVELY